MTAVVVLDALAVPPDETLRAALGAERHDRLLAALHERAVAWARAVGDGGPPLLAADGAEAVSVLADHAGPVLFVAPDVPGLSPQHAEAALDDVAEGVLLAVAMSGEGLPFLVAVPRPVRELLFQLGQPFDVIGATAMRLGGEVGVLRPERRLTTLADARALLVDPTSPPELRALLDGLE